MSAPTLFEDLEQRPAFRADIRYFVGLATNYIASIFIAVREGAPSKHRKAFAVWLDQHAPSMTDAKLREALVHRHRWFDCNKADFTIILETMPQPMKDRLGRALMVDHAIPMTLREFVATTDTLREYRHWLEHYDERISRRARRPVHDWEVLRLLGHLLIPHLLNHLCERIHSHARKAGVHQTDARGRTERARAICQAAIAARRAATMDQAGFRTRGTVVRKERQEAQAVHERWRQAHAARFSESTWPRYNLHNWKLRWFFYGPHRIEQLEQLLRHPDESNNAPVDFIQAVEPLFNLSADVALVIHDLLVDLKARGVNVAAKKQVGPMVPAIRNAVAHGDFFWTVAQPAVTPPKPIPVVEVFAELQRLCLSLPSGAKQLRNDFVTRLEATLRDAKVTLAYPAAEFDDLNRSPPPLRIRRWSNAVRERVAQGGMRIERRPALRRVTAQWMRALQQSQRQIDSVSQP